MVLGQPVKELYEGDRIVTSARPGRHPVPRPRGADELPLLHVGSGPAPHTQFLICRQITVNAAAATLGKIRLCRTRSAVFYCG